MSANEPGSRPTPERWREVEAMFLRTRDREPGERALFLEQACGADVALRQEVDSLLAADHGATGFLEPQGAPAPLGPVFEAKLRTELAGRYTLERELGSGGMATVYLAEDVRHHRQVAIKILHPELGAVLGAERFLREIDIAARLNHPHILPLFDSGALDGLLYYVMPHVEGESLRAALTAEKQMSVDTAIRIAREVAMALDYSHRRGVIHRDIKPENILLQDGQAIVADFGIARALDVAGTAGPSEPTFGTGTPAYMSPEQSCPGAKVDERTDIYSLGCVLYEMLAGEPAFRGASPSEIRARHAEGAPSLPREVAVPAGLERTVTRALATSPAKRFATAGEFAEALGRVEEPLPTLSLRSRAALVLGLGALAVAGGALMLRSRSGSVLPVAARIAVLPFVPTVADTGLTRLGEDLAGTVNIAMSGVGGVTTVDRYATLARAASTAGHSLESDVGLGRRFGAGSVLRGTLARQGDRVRVEATLVRSDRLVPIASAAAVAPPESLTALTDTLVLALLRQVWLGRAPPTPSLGAITTRSIPALRAFLDGERSLLTNRWNEAADEYRIAFGADSAFALAYSRYAEAQTWAHGDIELEVRRQLLAHRLNLPKRDRLLADERLSDTSSATRLRLLEQMTREYPDYWPGWVFYGDAIVHFGLLLGHPWSEGRAAFRHALAESPDLLPAWEHLGWISTGQDTAAFRQSIEQRVRLGYYRERPNGAASLRRDRLLEGLGRSDGRLVGPLEALADTVALDIAHVPDDQARLALVTELAFGFPQACVAVNRRVLTGAASPTVKSTALRIIALAWATRGQWDSAMTNMDRFVTESQDPYAPIVAYSLAVIGVSQSALRRAEADGRRAAAFAALAEIPTEDRALRRAYLYWMDGIVAFRRHDAATLSAIRDSLLALHSPEASWNARSLQAFERALQGDRAEAGRRLAALEWEGSDDARLDIQRYDMALSRLNATSWLIESGDTAQAARLLTFLDGKGGLHMAGTYAMASFAWLALARIEDRRGHAAAAREGYRQFLRRLDSPMAAQRGLVDEAKKALARLEGAPS